MTSLEQSARHAQRNWGWSQAGGDGHIPFTSGLSLVNLSTGDGANTPTRNTNASIPTLAPESPVLMGADISEYDIELEVFALSAGGRYSTDRLIPPSPSSTSLKDYQPPSAHGPNAQPASQKDALVPNYKPRPLRWPFALFLLALIAGVFAFMEYEVRNLPSKNFSVLEGFLPWRKLVAMPQPDPRPPEESYPEPFEPYDTYCGWQAPSWWLTTGIWVPSSCATEADDCDMLLAVTDLNEWILTFTTDDSSWCPCTIFQRFKSYDQEIWGMGLGMLGEVWDTTDHGCKSVMTAIESMNEYKTYSGSTTLSTRLGSSIPPFSSGEDGVWLTAVQSSGTMPPGPLTVSFEDHWQYASTDVYGNILIPMVTRAAGAETQDVFGKMVNPTDSALFPDRYLAKFTPRTTGSRLGSLEPNSCFWHPSSECLTETSQQSTTWWTLPLSKAAIISSTQPSSAMTTKSSAGTSLDSTPTAGLTSSVWQPAPTGTDSAQQSVEASTQESIALQPSTPQMSSTTAIVVLESTLISSHSAKSSDTPSDGTTESHNNSSPTSHGGNVILHDDNNTPTATQNNLTNNKTSTPSPTTTSLAKTPPPFPGFNPLWPPKGPISPKAQSSLVNLRSEADYLMVTVVPTLLATLLLVLLQVLTTSLNAVLPFRALRQPQGASPDDSLCLSRTQSAISAPSVAFRYLLHFKDPLPLLGTLVGGLATILVALSSEVIRLDVTTDCGDGDVGKAPHHSFNPERVCAYGLRKSGTLMRIAEGILVSLAVLVIAIAVILGRWKSGLAADPWSIASMAGMLKVNGELQTLLRDIPTSPTDGRRDIHTGTHVRQTLEGRRFRLGFSHEPEDDQSPSSTANYTIEVVPTPPEDNTPIRATARRPPTRKAQSPIKTSTWQISSITAELLVRITALLFTTGLLTLILQYELTVATNTTFEAFMNSQTIGVRILFAAFGTTLDAFWNYYFSYTTELQTHTNLATPHPARTSILLSPPSNVFIGLWRAISTHTKTRDPLPFHIALATLLAKFTTIVLANIPFSNAVTWKIHEVCTWTSVGVLSHMVLVLMASLLLPVWKTCRLKKNKGSGEAVEFPVRSDTIATQMYYICDSYMVKDFEGLSVMGSKERDRVVSGMGRWYGFGESMGVSGEVRVGVDYRCGECRGDRGRDGELRNGWVEGGKGVKASRR